MDGRQEIENLADLERESHLGKRQSVRFAGPNATPLMTRSITRRQAAPFNASYQSPRQSIEPHMRGSETSYLGNEESFAVIRDDFEESELASMPSSYRKIRKAKSMFSPGKAPSAVFADGTPGAMRHFHRHSMQSSDDSGERSRVPDPRLKRSYSFLRGGTDRITTSNRQYAMHDAAIQLARDTYLRQLEEQRLKEQPSFLNLGRRRTQKLFRRTVRSNSTNSYGSAIASPMIPINPVKVGLGQKARSLSQTLKKKIIRVFRQSSDDQPTIPAQQLNASHAHYQDYVVEFNGLENQYTEVPEPKAEMLHRISSRESKESDGPVLMDKAARPGSIRSAHSPSDDEERNDRSRVTSWTNSTAANTLTMPQMMERKRLSIIKEDGDPYQPSSPTPKHGSLTDGYAKFRQPISQNATGRVQTERVFSALQKEIHANNRKAGLKDEDADSNSTSWRQGMQHSISTPRRTSSMRLGAKSSSETVAHLIGPPATYFNHQQDYADFKIGLTPQEIADIDEPSLLKSRGPLREVKSAFFPSSLHLERTNTSPFRRALNATSDDEEGPQFDVSRASRTRMTSLVNLNKRQLNGSVAGSESVYSRSPGGHTMMAIGSSLSLSKSESSGEAGTAVIITSEPAKHHLPLTGRRYSSGDLSGTFKRFMATQVASLEDHERPHNQVYNAFPPRESRHRREHAQLDGDEVSIDRHQGSKDLEKQPLGIIQISSNTQVPTNHRPPFSTCEENPFIHTDPTLKGSATIQNENNPFRQSSFFGRKSGDAENAKVASSLISDLVIGLPKRSSQLSMLSQRDRNRVPNAAIVRHSPERTERLRRLTSKSSTSLRKTPIQRDSAAQDSCTTPSETLKQGYESDDSDTSLAASSSLAASNQKLVESSLKGRRREMRISEESNMDPAFS